MDGRDKMLKDKDDAMRALFMAHHAWAVPFLRPTAPSAYSHAAAMLRRLADTVEAYPMSDKDLAPFATPTAQE